MKARRAILFMITATVFGTGTKLYCQDKKISAVNERSACSVPSPETLKRRGKLSEEQEIRYRSPVRYVIVYNDIGPTDDRRIDVLMNADNINENDLRTVFCWIAEGYPSPVALTINVHTNLATIETPDERALLSDGDGTRFSKYVDLFKGAHYNRYDNGREAFGYTVNLSPYRDREVVIRTAK